MVYGRGHGAGFNGGTDIVNKPVGGLADHDLILRIDERQQVLIRDVAKIGAAVSKIQGSISFWRTKVYVMSLGAASLIAAVVSWVYQVSNAN